jgi:hypothetical protein
VVENLILNGPGPFDWRSTLRSHIEAIGGELEVVARFPDGAVKISNFSNLESKATV